MNIYLTSGERRVVERVVSGRRNVEIAQELGMSPRTVEWHLTNVYRKLNVRSRTEMVLRIERRRPKRASRD